MSCNSTVEYLKVFEAYELENLCPPNPGPTTHQMVFSNLSALRQHPSIPGQKVYMLVPVSDEALSALLTGAETN